MKCAEDFPRDSVETFIEIRGVYDGWSVARMKDGTLANRWPEDDRRHKPTQDWIASYEDANSGETA